jgi:glycerate kinase
VTTRFGDAAVVFGPQKGADAAAVRRLAARLEGLRWDYREAHGIDPHDVPGSGAAGGLGGGLLTLGARLVPGVEVVAAAVGLDEAVRGCDVVVTGEGLVDETSRIGKVVGAVTERARRMRRRVLVVAGDADPGVFGADIEVVSLVRRFGRQRAFGDTAAAVEQAVLEALSRDQGSL